MAKQHKLVGASGSSRRDAGLEGIGKACVEALEGRTLLAVTAGEYDAIRSTYPGFNLPADMALVNIIEVASSQLGVASLKSAITAAGGTTLPDLVVLRTTDTQNTITYASSADAISIDIPSAQGAISIVGFGSKPLTIDAASMESVIHVGSINSTTTVNLGGMRLTGGYATFGGGVDQISGTLTLMNVTISGNIASEPEGRGGGLYLCGSGTLAMTNVTISGNTASGLYGGGGGVYQYNGTSTLTNVTINGNTASGSRGKGGGAYLYDGRSTLTNVTISGNMARDEGGGLYLYFGVSTLRNTIVARDAARTGPDLYGYYPTLSGSNSLIGDGGGRTYLVDGVGGNLVGTSASPIDPKLAEGSGFGTGLSPLPGSPAIDAGDNSLIPIGIATDIYGAPRIQGARVNIGAVETVLPEMPSVTYVVTSLGDSTAADGVLTLREALAAANSNQAVGDALAGSYSSADVIAFAPSLSGTIRTNGQAFQIISSVSITGPSAGRLILDGGGASGVLDIRGPYDVSISGMTIRGGNAAEGGGVYAAGSRLTLDQIVISGNTASDDGGGVYQYYGTSTLTNVTMSGNGASNYGGGLYSYYGTSTLMNATISGGKASDGGGVYQYYGTSTLRNVTISGGRASEGGGVYQYYGTSMLTNVTISGNKTSWGGGIYVDHGTSTLTNVTISGNAASVRGGGVHLFFGSLILWNTIAAQNGADIYSDIYQYASSTLSGANNLIGNGAGQTSLVNGNSGNLVGTSASPIDPRFVNIVGTDWTTWDLRLQATSPAVDAGDNAWIPTGVTTDIMGGTRISNGTVDMGAYEHQPTDIVLSANAVSENRASGAVAGRLSMMDSNPGDTFTYLLVAGDGSTDNASFTISGNQLLTAAIFDYEAKSSYSIRVRSTDQGGLWCERVFTINVTNVNEAPTSITLSSSSIAENQPTGTTVGTLSTTDPDSGNTFAYSLVSGAGSTDNGSFTISGSTLKTARSFDYEAKNSYSIRVRTMDQWGLWYDKVFTISVTDVDEIAPTVTAVYVRGSTWSSGYLSFMAANLAGSSATYGYAIPVGSGAAQLQTLPWRNLNQISIAFSEDVSIAQAQFAIAGSIGSYSVSGFSFSSADHVATWSLSAAIGPDKLYVALPGSGSSPVRDTAGNVLDGEWVNPSSYSDAGSSDTFPSGNGTAGGDFAFRFDVLPGDSTGGSLGKVNVADVLQSKGRSSLPVSLSTYRSDFDGNNLVNVADVLYVKGKSSVYSLPVNPPVVPVFGAMSQVSLLQKDRALTLW